MNYKKYLFPAIVFFLFSMPFFILSRHFLGTIKYISQKDELRSMEFKAKLISARLSEILNLKYDVLNPARDPKFINASLEEKKKNLLTIAVGSKDIVKELMIAESSGREIFSTLKNKKYGDYAANNVFKNSVFENISVGAVSYLEDAPPELLLAEPIIKVKGEKPKYILMARLSLGELNRQFLRISKDSSKSMALLDGGGQVICDSAYNYLFSSGLYAESELTGSIKKAKKANMDSVAAVISLNRENMLFAAARVESSDWWVYETAEAEKSVDYHLYGWGKKVVFTGFLLMLIFSFMTRWIYEKISCWGDKHKHQHQIHK